MTNDRWAKEVQHVSQVVRQYLERLDPDTLECPYLGTEEEFDYVRDTVDRFILAIEDCPDYGRKIPAREWELRQHACDVALELSHIQQARDQIADSYRKIVDSCQKIDRHLAAMEMSQGQKDEEPPDKPVGLALKELVQEIEKLPGVIMDVLGRIDKEIKDNRKGG